MKFELKRVREESLPTMWGRPGVGWGGKWMGMDGAGMTMEWRRTDNGWVLAGKKDVDMVNWVVYDAINMNIGMVPMGMLDRFLKGE